MAEELRQIRMKCIKTASEDEEFTYKKSDPTNKMVASLLNALKMVKDYAT